MKRFITSIVVIALMVFAHTANGQLRKIPSDVTDAFKAKYPAATSVEWKDKLSSFQADFKMGETVYRARFNSKGELQETEKELEESALPPAVQEGFDKSKYSEWELKDASFLEKREVAYFRILVRKNDFEKKFLFFDANGKLVKEQITL